MTEARSPEFARVREIYEDNVTQSQRANNPMCVWAIDADNISDEQRELCFIPEVVESYDEVYVGGVKFRPVWAEKRLKTCNSGVIIDYFDAKNNRIQPYYGIIQQLYIIQLGEQGPRLPIAKVYWMHDEDHKHHVMRGSDLRRVTKGTVEQHTQEPWVFIDFFQPRNVLFWPRDISGNGEDFYVIERFAKFKCDCDECIN